MTPLENLKRLDDVCDAFEANWWDASIASVPQLLQDVDPSLQIELLTQLLWVDLDMRFAHDLVIGLETYQRYLSSHDEALKAAYSEYMNRLALNDTVKSTPAEVARTASSKIEVLQPNSRLGNYHIENCLSRGHFGAVYLGTEISTQRKVVIKVPNSQACDSRLFIKPAIENSQLANLKNCESFYIVHDTEQPYLVYRFLERENLAEIVAKGSMSISEAIEIVRKLCESFSYSHSKDVISSTLHLSAPEQFVGAEASKQTDVFTLGVLLYELLTRRSPFEGATVGQITANVLKCDPLKPSSLNLEVPSALDVVCLQAIVKDPKKRYQSMMDFHAALALMPPQPRGSFRKRVTAYIGILTSLILLAVIVWACSR